MCCCGSNVPVEEVAPVTDMLPPPPRTGGETTAVAEVEISALGVDARGVTQHDCPSVCAPTVASAGVVGGAGDDALDQPRKTSVCFVDASDSTGEDSGAGRGGGLRSPGLREEAGTQDVIAPGCAAVESGTPSVTAADADASAAAAVPAGPAADAAADAGAASAAGGPAGASPPDSTHGMGEFAGEMNPLLAPDLTVAAADGGGGGGGGTGGGMGMFHAVGETGDAPEVTSRAAAIGPEDPAVAATDAVAHFLQRTNEPSAPDVSSPLGVVSSPSGVIAVAGQALHDLEKALSWDAVTGAIQRADEELAQRRSDEEHATGVEVDVDVECAVEEEDTGGAPPLSVPLDVDVCDDTTMTSIAHGDAPTTTDEKRDETMPAGARDSAPAAATASSTADDEPVDVDVTVASSPFFDAPADATLDVVPVQPVAGEVQPSVALGLVAETMRPATVTLPHVTASGSQPAVTDAPASAAAATGGGPDAARSGGSVEMSVEPVSAPGHVDDFSLLASLEGPPSRAGVVDDGTVSLDQGGAAANTVGGGHVFVNRPFVPVLPVIQGQSLGNPVKINWFRPYVPPLLPAPPTNDVLAALLGAHRARDEIAALGMGSGDAHGTLHGTRGEKTAGSVAAAAMAAAKRGASLSSEGGGGSEGDNGGESVAPAPLRLRPSRAGSAAAAEPTAAAMAVVEPVVSRRRKQTDRARRVRVADGKASAGGSGRGRAGRASAEAVKREQRRPSAAPLKRKREESHGRSKKRLRGDTLAPSNAGDDARAVARGGGAADASASAGGGVPPASARSVSGRVKARSVAPQEVRDPTIAATTLLGKNAELAIEVSTATHDAEKGTLHDCVAGYGGSAHDLSHF